MGMHSGQVTFAGIGDPPVGVGTVECSRGADEADDRRTCRRSAAKRGGPEAALGRRGEPQGARDGGGGANGGHHASH